MKDPESQVYFLASGSTLKEVATNLPSFILPVTSDYDAFERLFIQKEKLVETISFCRTNRLKKLEIIHGIGDGVLQKMVYDYLHSQTNLEFDDHDFFYHQRGSVLVTLR